MTASTARQSVFRLALVAAVCVALAVSPYSSVAADPAFVGKLALAADPDVAQRLGLSDETQKALSDLIDKRENEVVNLTLEIRNLPPAEREAKLAPFREASEREGLKLLSAEQAAKLEQVRIERAGSAALLEPSVLEKLKLSDSQRSQIDSLLKEQKEALAKVPPAAQTALKAEYDRKVAALLDDTQRASWDSLVGKSGTATTGSAPSSDTAQRDSGERRGPSGFSGRRGSRGGPGGGRNSVAGGGSQNDGPRQGPGPATPIVRSPNDKPAVEAAGDGKLRFNSRMQPWRDVIEWFADQAQLSLYIDETPVGTFNYQDSKAYTPEEAIDLLNSILLNKGYALVRRERMLTLVNLQNGVPPHMVRHVTEDELAKCGEFEIVSMLFRLDRWTPEEAEAEVKKLVGSWNVGGVVLLPKARQLVVTETAGKLRTIKNVIDSLERPQGPASDTLKVLTVRNSTAQHALDQIKLLLNIPTTGSATSDGSLRIVVDATGRNILASGKADAIAKLEQILSVVDGDTPGSTGGAVVRAPQLEVYSLAGADPATVLQVLQTLLAGIPNVRLATEPATGSLIAWAPMEQQLTIRSTIAQMQRDSRQFEVIRLRNVDPQAAATAITKLFATGTETGASSAPKVEAETTLRQLIVRGTSDQIAQIKTMLEKMGETEVHSDAVASDERSNIRMLPIKGRAARTVLGQLEQVWPTLHKNRIRVVTPSSLSPTSAEGESSYVPPSFDGGIAQRRPIGDVEQATRAIVIQPRPSATSTEATGAGRAARKPALPVDEQPAPSIQRQPDANRDTSVIRKRLNELVAELPGEARRKLQVTFANQRTEVEQKDGAIEEIRDAIDTPTRSAETTKSADEPATRDVPLETPDAQESDGDPAEVIIAPGPDGIVIASKDMKALDDLEALIRSMASRTLSTDRDFTVFYLKYAKAQVVAELLEQIFGGGSSSGGGGRSFMNDIAGAAFGDGMMGSLLFGGSGDSGTPTTIRATGTVAIVPDSRLNALVVQANSTDLDTVEQLLKVLDQKSSPEDVLVLAKPQIIPVYNTSAEEVANVVRQVYADRIAGPAGQQRQPNPEDFIRALRGGGGRGGRGGGGRNGNDRGEETQKMTVGVDARTNSLVVSAPDNLFSEVKLLVEQLDTIDTGANETMKVVTLKRSNPTAVQTALQQIVGEQLRTTTQSSTASRNNNNNSNRNRTGGGQNNGQNRAQAFNQIFGGGGAQGGGGFQGGFQGGGGGGRNFGGGGGFGGGGNFGGQGGGGRRGGGGDGGGGGGGRGR